MAALKMTLHPRQPQLPLLHHSDQRQQYTNTAYQQLFEEYDIQVSMNGVGTWYDNAPMRDVLVRGESFFGTLKAERVHHVIYRTRQEAPRNLFRYIESFCNRRRVHSSIDYCSPVAFEQAYHQQLCTT